MRNELAERRKALAAKLYLDVFGKGRLDTADEILAPDVVSHAVSDPPRPGTNGIKAAGCRSTN
jgi:hypothetical protein